MAKKNCSETWQMQPIASRGSGIALELHWTPLNSWNAEMVRQVHSKCCWDYSEIALEMHWNYCDFGGLLLICTEMAGNALKPLWKRFESVVISMAIASQVAPWSPRGGTETAPELTGKVLWKMGGTRFALLSNGAPKMGKSSTNSNWLLTVLYAALPFASTA